MNLSTLTPAAISDPAERGSERVHGEVSPQSIIGRFQRFVLSSVRKPGRYWCDQEIRHGQSQPADGTARAPVVLLVPDSYERGYHRSNLHRLTRAAGSLPRCFLYEADALAALRLHSLPPLTLNEHLPLGNAAVIVALLDQPGDMIALGVMLTAAGIPLIPGERNVDHPLLLSFGALNLTPTLPLNWLDAILCTDDPNQAVSAINSVLSRPDATARRDALASAELFVTRDKLSRGGIRWHAIRNVDPSTASGSAETIHVPLIDTARDAFPLPLWSGGADPFFPAGELQSAAIKVNAAELGGAVTQFQTSGMSTLEIASAPDIAAAQWIPAVRSLIRQLDGTGTTLGLPLIRPECCSPELLEALARLRPAPLQFMAVTGSARLRKLFQLGESDQVMRAVQTAFDKGWRQVTLLFWVGLPTETPEDEQATITLIQQLSELTRTGAARSLVIQLRPFVPVPHTPFQWDAMPDPATLERFKSLCQRRGIHGINFRIDDRPLPYFSTALRRMHSDEAGRFLEKLTRRYLDSLDRPEFNRPELLGIPLEQLVTEEEWTGLRARGQALSFSTPLPWTAMERTHSHPELQRQRTVGATTLAENVPATAAGSAVRPDANSNTFGREKKRLTGRTLSAPTRNRIRLQLERGAELRYLSHLDFLRLIERSIRRARLPIAWSGEAQPLMKLSFGPPLPLGATSSAEFVDLTLETASSPSVIERLGKAFPPGLQIAQAAHVFGRELSLTAALNRVTYSVPLSEWEDAALVSANAAALLQNEQIMIERDGKQGIRQIDLRPAIRQIQVRENALLLTLVLEEGCYARPAELIRLLDSGLRFPVASVPVHRERLFREDQNGQITDGMHL